jgi:hypothetical protein
MRSLIWMKAAGAEYAEVDLTEGLAAEGTAVGSGPVPYRLEYSLRTSAGHVTQALAVRAAGAGWVRTLDLRRDAGGTWTIEAEGTGDLDGPAPGGSPDLSGVLDCDLGMSPLTNTMPVLRHGLLHGGARTAFVMAWVRVPHLEVIRHEQWYTPLGPLQVRYESAGFGADLTFDQDGLVLDYPGLGWVLSP